MASGGVAGNDDPRTNSNATSLSGTAYLVTRSARLDLVAYASLANDCLLQLLLVAGVHLATLRTLSSSYHKRGAGRKLGTLQKNVIYIYP